MLCDSRCSASHHFCAHEVDRSTPLRPVRDIAHTEIENLSAALSEISIQETPGTSVKKSKVTVTKWQCYVLLGTFSL